MSNTRRLPVLASNVSHQLQSKSTEDKDATKNPSNTTNQSPLSATSPVPGPKPPIPTKPPPGILNKMSPSQRANNLSPPIPPRPSVPLKTQPTIPLKSSILSRSDGVNAQEVTNFLNTREEKQQTIKSLLSMKNEKEDTTSTVNSPPQNSEMNDIEKSLSPTIDSLKNLESKQTDMKDEPNNNISNNNSGSNNNNNNNSGNNNNTAATSNISQAEKKGSSKKLKFSEISKKISKEKKNLQSMISDSTTRTFRGSNKLSSPSSSPFSSSPSLLQHPSSPTVYTMRTSKEQTLDRTIEKISQLLIEQFQNFPWFVENWYIEPITVHEKTYEELQTKIAELLLPHILTKTVIGHIHSNSPEQTPSVTTTGNNLSSPRNPGDPLHSGNETPPLSCESPHAIEIPPFQLVPSASTPTSTPSSTPTPTPTSTSISISSPDHSIRPENRQSPIITHVENEGGEKEKQKSPSPSVVMTEKDLNKTKLKEKLISLNHAPPQSIAPSPPNLSSSVSLSSSIVSATTHNTTKANTTSESPPPLSPNSNPSSPNATRTKRHLNLSLRVHDGNDKKSPLPNDFNSTLNELLGKRPGGNTSDSDMTTHSSTSNSVVSNDSDHASEIIHSNSDELLSSSHNFSITNSNNNIVVNTPSDTSENQMFDLDKAALIIEVINLNKLLKEWIELVFSASNNEAQIDQLIQKSMSCTNALKSIFETVCSSVMQRQAEICEKVVKHLEAPNFRKLNEANDLTLNAMKNERSSVIKILYNKKKELIESNAISLRSVYSSFLSILWDPKVDSQTSMLHERDQLLIIIMCEKIVNQMEEILETVNLVIKLYEIHEKNIDLITVETEDDNVMNTRDKINIYDDDIDKSDWPDGAGTLNSLVTTLTGETGNRITKAFMSTYQAFTTPWKLFNKLMERYDVPFGMLSSSSAIQLRVALVLRYWMEHSFSDIDEQLQNKIKIFIDTTLKLDHYNSGNILEKTFNDKRQQLSNNNLLMLKPLSYFIKEQHYEHMIDQLFQSSPAIIAQQLTIIDWEIFKNIERTGLLNTSWANASRCHRSIYINKLIDRINHVSYWVASIIVTFVNVNQRVEIFKKFCKIAEELKNVNNMSTLAGIVAAFNLAAISRLSQTKAVLSRKYLKILEELKILFDPSLSYKNYRNHMSKVVQPAIPYIGVNLSDLILIDEGNLDYFPGGYINFSKQELVYSVVTEVVMYQQKAYPFTKQEPLFSYLLSLPSFDEDQLYELSILREPRIPLPTVNNNVN